MRTLSVAVGHRALEMRNAADDVDAHRERLLQELDAVGASQHAVLRERDELQVEVRLHALLARAAALRRREDAGRTRRRASGSRAAPSPRPSRSNASARSTIASCVSSGFNSPHSAMPSSSVPLWLTRGNPYDSVASMWKCASTNGGVSRLPPRVDHFRRGRVDARRHVDDAAAGDEHVHAGAAIGQRRVADQKVGHGLPTSCRRSGRPRRRAPAGCSRGR